jgi:hypothetical protein
LENSRHYFRFVERKTQEVVKAAALAASKASMGGLGGTASAKSFLVPRHFLSKGGKIFFDIISRSPFWRDSSQALKVIS